MKEPKPYQYIEYYIMWLSLAYIVYQAANQGMFSNYYKMYPASIIGIVSGISLAAGYLKDYMVYLNELNKHPKH